MSNFKFELDLYSIRQLSNQLVMKKLLKWITILYILSNSHIIVSEYKWKIEGVDIHIASPINSTKIRSGPDGLLAVILVNQQSGIKQIGTVCNDPGGGQATDRFCQNFGHKSGKWIKEPENIGSDIKYVLRVKTTLSTVHCHSTSHHTESPLAPARFTRI